MPRPHQEAYDLSDAEKRDLIKLIEQGKPLPEKYRFLLFADKREVELVWNGKTREVCTAILPFQTLEHIDEPRKEKRDDEELGLDTGGRQVKGWTNKLIWGDNKLILSSLESGGLRRQIEDAGGLKLIYIDPPFDVGADFSMDIEMGGETFHKEPNLLEQIAYRDTWGRGADSFISMIYERLILMRDLMHDEGSIYLHMMPTVAPFIELAVAEVFGRDRMLGSLVWQRATAHGNAGVRYAAVTDRIIWLSRIPDRPVAGGGACVMRKGMPFCRRPSIDPRPWESIEQRGGARDSTDYNPPEQPPRPPYYNHNNHMYSHLQHDQPPLRRQKVRRLFRDKLPSASSR